VLDEPTNDLDVETLELLEELLTEYKGTLLLVSHDRTFLDNVVTSTLVFEGKGKVKDYVGGYTDWLRQRKQTLSSRGNLATKTSKKTSNKSGVKDSQSETGKIRKLGYREQLELEELPAKIEALENEQTEIQGYINDEKFYQQDKDLISSKLLRLEAIGKELEYCFERWGILEKS
jgi:ATP-binding cassette subfamily F protein uup